MTYCMYYKIYNMVCCLLRMNKHEHDQVTTVISFVCTTQLSVCVCIVSELFCHPLLLYKEKIILLKRGKKLHLLLYILFIISFF